MSERIERQLEASSVAYQDAIARTKALHAEAMRARQEATQAASQGEAMLVDVATGEVEDLDDDALLAAHEAAKRAAAVAAIAERKRDAALRQQHLAQIEKLRATAAAMQSDYDNSVSRLIEIADVVDEALADLQATLDAFHTQQEAVKLAYHQALMHNSHSLDHGHAQNPILKDMSPDQQPKVIIPRVVPSSNVKGELYENHGAGSINARHVTVHALAPRMRQAHNRPVRA